MSTDYTIFLDSEYTSAEAIVQPLLEIPGVEFCAGLQIRGLTAVYCKQLTLSHREVMREDYGEFSLDVNWEINGTYDKQTDIIEVMKVLFECAALLVNTHPDKSLSLMRNGESFYVFNTQNRLIISPVYLEAFPSLKSLFNKPSELTTMDY